MSRKRHHFLGLDLGAGSGRAVLGTLQSGRLALRDLHRFEHGPVKLGKVLGWNFLSLWANVVDSLRVCAQGGFIELSGIGIDSWGVDFGLVRPTGELLGNPRCYRDAITNGVERFIARTLPEEELFRVTGLSVGRVRTLSQLVGMARNGGSAAGADKATFLMIPDLLRYYLGGRPVVERTSAGSAQLMDVRTGGWSKPIFQKFKVPLAMMPKLVNAGTVGGTLLREVCQSTGLKPAPLMVVAGHDTASAAAAVPFVADDCAFVSCGAWSVLGKILSTPDTSPRVLRAGFLNEYGLESILFVKNLSGLYLFENLRRQFIREGQTLTYRQIMKDAGKAKPFAGWINLDAPRFFVSDRPRQQVKEHLRQTKQRGMRSNGEFFRSILESLAFSYRRSIEVMRELTDQPLRRLCLVGGGSRNDLLCQMVADATGLEVIAGPAEATVIGNLGCQALAAGLLKQSGAIRSLVQNSFSLKTYQPRDTQAWDNHYARYLDCCERTKEL